jgi:hypothetical protein
MAKYYSIKKSNNPKKETAWKWFSKYIRLRDAIRTTGDIYYAKCITCGKTESIEDMDAGHAIAGRSNPILFNEYVCNAQCRRCNRGGGGELQMYKRIIIERYGQERWDFWESEKRKAFEYSQLEYEQLAKMYRNKYKELTK